MGEIAAAPQHIRPCLSDLHQSAKLAKLAALGGTMKSQTKMAGKKAAAFEQMKQLDDEQLLQLPVKMLVDMLKYMDVKKELVKPVMNEKLRDGKPDKRKLVKLVLNQVSLEGMTKDALQAYGGVEMTTIGERAALSLEASLRD